MKINLALISILFSTAVSGITQEERASKLSQKRIKDAVYTVNSDEDCKSNTDRVKKIQKLITKSSATENGEGKVTLLDLEKEYDAQRAEQVILTGLKSINQKYKKFLNEVSGLKGWNIPGFDESKDFTLQKLQEDLNTTEEHLNNVATMGIMDALLKEAIKNPDDLLTSESSGRETFEQLKKSCEAGDTSTLCKAIRKADETGKRKIQATVEGFVSAYRASQVGGVLPGIRKELKLENYRDVLLEGVGALRPEDFSQDIQNFVASHENFKQLVSDKDKVKSLSDDVSKFKTCLARQALGTATAPCTLAETTSKEFSKTFDAVAGLQSKIIKNLGGPNEQLEKSLESVHGLNKMNEKLGKLQKIYAGEEDFEKALSSKMETNEEDIADWTQNIFMKVNQRRNNVEIHKKMISAEGKYDEKMMVFLTSKASLEKPDGLSMKQTNDEMKKMLKEILLASCEGKNAQASCAEAQLIPEKLFKEGTNGGVQFDDAQLESFLNLIEKDTLQKGTAVKQVDLDKRMSANLAKQKLIKDSLKFKTLNDLLTFYGDKVQKNCTNKTDEKAQWRCVTDKSGNKNSIHALVGETGNILARMPGSPQRLGVTDLNSRCSADFINSFSSEDKEDVDGMCTKIAYTHHNFLKKYEPIPEEKIYAKYDRYWDGNKFVTKKRPSKWAHFGKSALTQVIGVGVFKVGLLGQEYYVDSWEQNTIQGIENQNQYYKDLYSGNFGPFYPSPGFFPYLGGGGYNGAIYNNGFTTFGASGAFPTTFQTAGFTGATSTGFNF